MMAEVLRRRFSRVARLRRETGAPSLDVGADERRGSARTASCWTSSRMPDRSTTRRRPRAARGRTVPSLVIVDGGKGQLSAAVGALSELGITDAAVRPRQALRELYVPDRAAPIVLPRRSQALYLVQRIRDEAHRFAITYHRDVRGKRALRASSTTSRASVRAGRRRC